MRFLSLLACAFSFLQWLKRRLFSPSTMDEQDFHRLDNLAGWYGPEVAEAFKEYHAEKGYHKLKNIAVEWNKADSQRGIKFMSLASILVFLIGVGIGAAIAQVL